MGKHKALINSNQFKVLDEKAFIEIMSGFGITIGSYGDNYQDFCLSTDQYTLFMETYSENFKHNLTTSCFEKAEILDFYEDIDIGDMFAILQQVGIIDINQSIVLSLVVILGCTFEHYMISIEGGYKHIYPTHDDIVDLVQDADPKNNIFNGIDIRTIVDYTADEECECVTDEDCFTAFGELCKFSKEEERAYGEDLKKAFKPTGEKLDL